MRDAADDWRRYDPAAIPSKDATPWLDRFLRDVPPDPTGRMRTLLDVGCGTGRVTVRLAEPGFAVTGVDINAEAIRAAKGLTGGVDRPGRAVEFVVADFAATSPPAVTGVPFDVAVCQLVLSIVGGADARANLLRHLHAALRPDGWLYLSASGVSDSINANYARLYAEDLPLTGERHSYLSRNDRGEILYQTRHFTADELERLLAAAGFDRIRIESVEEASSRRPLEAAVFHYATCRRP